MSVSIFTETSDFEQVSEMIKYMKERERCLDVEVDEDEWQEALASVIENLDLLFEEEVSDNDMGGIINCIVSLILLMNGDNQASFVLNICKMIERKMSNNEKKEKIKLFALNTLFLGLVSIDLKIKSYESLLNAEINSDKKHLININLASVSEWLTEWKCTQTETILRQLHRIFIDRQDNAHATECMMKLLGSFTEERASDALKDAEQCIVAALKDPHTLTMDQILTYAPVRCLAGKPIHTLLTIFVEGTIKDYKLFVQNNPNFLEEYKLDNVTCLNKIRILTLMQLAAGDTTELSYETIEEQLQLDRSDLEGFVIEAVRQQAITCKLDQQQERVLITGAVPRTFGVEQWKTLHTDLQMWQHNFKVIIGSLSKLKTDVI